MCGLAGDDEEDDVCCFLLALSDVFDELEVISVNL